MHYKYLPLTVLVGHTISLYVHVLFVHACLLLSSERERDPSKPAIASRHFDRALERRSCNDATLSTLETCNFHLQYNLILQTLHFICRNSERDRVLYRQYTVQARQRPRKPLASASAIHIVHVDSFALLHAHARSTARCYVSAGDRSRSSSKQSHVHVKEGGACKAVQCSNFYLQYNLSICARSKSLNAGNQTD